MRRPRIYTEQALRPNASISLEPGPGRHIARSLRMRSGEALILFDGRGGQYPATLTTVDKGAVIADTAEFEPLELESSLRLHLGIAISRGERMDWIVQKATELGVDCITPLFTARTEVKLAGERAQKKRRHWQQVAIGACEQCGRNRLPIIQPLQSVDDWLAATRADCRLVLHPHQGAKLETPANPPGSVALLVGPEGGLSPQEVEAAGHAGFSALQLGPRVLRTETAPLAAIAILQARWGDMS